MEIKWRLWIKTTETQVVNTLTIPLKNANIQGNRSALRGRRYIRGY